MGETTRGTEQKARVVFAATDLSDPADEALRQAHERALAADARLTVCHVVPDLLRVNTLFPQRTIEQVGTQAALEQHSLQALVDRTCAVTGRAVDDFTPLLDRGAPYAAIVAQAERVGAELVVVGDRGASGLSRMLLGSVAERVVRYAHAPVLVARAGARTGRVVVATDLSDPSLPALQAAVREGRRPGVRVTAVHCAEPVAVFAGPDHGPAGAPVVTPASAAEERERAQANLAAALQQCGFEGDQRVVVGSPTVAILATAEELRAELIILGTRGKTGLWRVLLGSVAEAVVRHAACSVLVVRLTEDARPAAITNPRG
jgi:nucleotide-binding universal stress UspA family protein